MGGAGSDTLTGGLGQDQFVYTNLLDSGDIIKDFKVGEDQMVLSELMNNLGYGGNNPLADGYVRLVQGNSHTSVQIDSDGQAGNEIFRQLATLENVSAATLGSRSVL